MEAISSPPHISLPLSLSLDDPTAATNALDPTSLYLSLSLSRGCTRVFIYRKQKIKERTFA